LDDTGMLMGLVLAEDFLQAWQYQRQGSTADGYMQ